MPLPTKKTAFALLAFLFGFFSFVLAFADLGLGEHWPGRAIMTALYFLFCGLILGFFNPDGWMMAGLTAWGCILIGIFFILAANRPPGSIGGIPPMDITSGLIMLVMPVGLALVGGYFGSLLKGKKMH